MPIFFNNIDEFKSQTELYGMVKKLLKRFTNL